MYHKILSHESLAHLTGALNFSGFQVRVRVRLRVVVCTWFGQWAGGCGKARVRV